MDSGSTLTPPFFSIYTFPQAMTWGSRDLELSGEDWLKSPSLVRHSSNHLHELSYNSGAILLRNVEQATTSSKNLGEVRRREEATVHMSYQSPTIPLSGIHLDWAMWEDPESEWLAKDNQETNSITTKPEIASHVAKQSSGFPFSAALYLGSLFQ